MTTTEPMIIALEEQAVIDFNTKLSLIKTIFEQEKFIGIEEKHANKYKYYFNDRFDMFYDKSTRQLEVYQSLLDGYCKAYFNSINTIEHE